MSANTPKFLYVNTSVGQIHARVYENKGPTLVCLHPMPYSGVYYDSFCKHLTKETHFSAVSLDMVGYGRSETINAPITIQDYAQSSTEAIQALISTSTISNTVSLLGFHTGSAIANEIGIAHPDLINNIVFVTYPFFDTDKREELLGSLSTSNIDDNLESLSSMWDFTVANRAEGVPFDRALWNFSDQLQNIHNGWFGFHAMFNYVSEERLPLLTQPTLIINDDSSLTDPTKTASEFIQNKTYTELKNTSGGIFELNIDQIVEQVRTFLSTN
jgi:pimeloyl-ACP methyl ester carboxylesterase